MKHNLPVIDKKLPGYLSIREIAERFAVSHGFMLTVLTRPSTTLQPVYIGGYLPHYPLLYYMPDVDKYFEAHPEFLTRRRKTGSVNIYTAADLNQNNFYKNCRRFLKILNDVNYPHGARKNPAHRATQTGSG